MKAMKAKPFESPVSSCAVRARVTDRFNGLGLG